MIYDPSPPDADGDGYVAKPNIDVVTEMVNMMAATRAYQARISIAAGYIRVNRMVSGEMAADLTVPRKGPVSWIESVWLPLQAVLLP